VLEYWSAGLGDCTARSRHRFAKDIFHHEEREGHEDRIKKRRSKAEKNVFFLRAFLVLLILLERA
jgi:hypothetical protein